MKGNDTISALSAGKALIANDNVSIIKMRNGKLYRLAIVWKEATIDFNQLLSQEMESLDGKTLHMNTDEFGRWIVLDDPPMIKPEEVQPHLVEPEIIPEPEDEPEDESEDEPEDECEDIIPEPEDDPEDEPETKMYPVILNPPAKGKTKREYCKDRIYCILARNVQPMHAIDIIKSIHSKYDTYHKKAQRSAYTYIYTSLDMLVEEGRICSEGSHKNRKFFIKS